MFAAVTPEPQSGRDDYRLQPLLHDLISTVLAPTSALSGADGQIRPHGVQGLFHADSRALSQALLLVDGAEPEAVGYAPAGTGRSRFTSLARHLGDRHPDPTVRLDRWREVSPYGMSERVEVASTATMPVTTTVSIELGCDFAPIEVVKSGGDTAAAEPVRTGPGQLSWRSGDIRVTATGEGATITGGNRLEWTVTLLPRSRVTLSWDVTVADPDAVVAAPPGPLEWSIPQVTADDRRLIRLFDQAMDDLRGLRLTESTRPEASSTSGASGSGLSSSGTSSSGLSGSGLSGSGLSGSGLSGSGLSGSLGSGSLGSSGLSGSGDTFLGAGVPWFLTLFGRDSLWAASMMLPLGTTLAAGTLRTLARRQGTKLDPATGEAPGKIMHELRRNEFVDALSNVYLPAAYYGTIDATPLWITLLHDAWRWGLPEAEVAALLPSLEAALGWLGDHADPDGDGFVEYIDASGRGLANQGWKDSGDSVRFHHGGQAEPPIALVEVQGYAHEAALAGAALLEAFGRPGAESWREYAAALAERFRAQFWVDGPLGRYPALALDRDKRPVDALTSNIGHLLGTGLLSPEESAQVAGLLGGPALAGGFGLRTMSALDGGFSPLSYHCGSIWPHDTAIVIARLAREGFGAQAATLAEGLLGAGESFGYRLPELFAGDDREAVFRPVPYPAACRPQAWSAAAAVTIAHAAVGLYPDVPEGRVTLLPMAGAPLGAVAARGLRVGSASVDVHVDHTGKATVTGLPSGMSLSPGG
ncbi:amylo-alpha-1,6-glucosidase [Acrocarpospora catenulata]|uniref:amylo-alpha-1,6-glucosidase n=1 Tax=Acrocarpospora catenulata TaxID=2836182 RepID=UPI0027DF4574|nr:glycogen debranching N-terminal domain-containing protein [Acrocarpospora catenulata]